MMAINFDKVIYKLLCVYAFLIPFEKVLEVFFDIETVLKPYRVIALIILGVFGIKTLYRADYNKDIGRDIYLYLIFIYGFALSFYRMITERFYLGLFYSDSFQILLYLGIFTVMKFINLTREQTFDIFKSFAWGIFLNCCYLLFKFVILKGFTRDAGFMDNPNYLALGIALAILLLINQRPTFKGLMRALLWFLLMSFFILSFIISGSRTGFAVLVICGFFALYFSSARIRRNTVFFFFLISIFIGVRYSEGISDTGPLILLNRLQKNSSEDPRIPIWKGTIAAAQDTYFTGLGIGQFKGNFHRYFYDENNGLVKRIVRRGYFLSPHSDYFALLAIYGLPGLMLYLAYILVNSRLMILELLRPEIESRQRLFFQYSFMAFFALILFGLAAENFISPSYWLVLGASTRLNFI